MPERVLCSAIIRRTGLRCSCYSNDNSGKCGRHGGLTIRQSQQIRQARQMREAEQRIQRVLDRQRGRAPGIAPSNHTYEIAQLEVFLRDMRIIQARTSVNLKKVKNYDCFICIEDDIKDGGVELKCCKQTCCSSCLEKWRSSSCPHCRATM
jgi:hypothetical protein